MTDEEATNWYYEMRGKPDTLKRLKAGLEAAQYLFNFYERSVTEYYGKEFKQSLENLKTFLGEK